MAGEDFMQDDPAAYVGSIPEQYDRNLGPVLFADYAEDISHRVAACQPRRVLEIAAGTGIVTRQLRNLLPDGVELTATDLNSPMLEIARMKFRPDELVEFRPADAAALPFADNSFDVLLCQFGVMFFPDKDKSYREARRVLVPGGHYLFSVWDSHQYNSFARITHQVTQSFFPTDPPQFQSVPFGYRFDPIKDSLLAAGFTNIVAVLKRLEKAVPDLSTLARGQVYGSPIIDHVRQRGGMDGEKIVAAIARKYREEFGDDPAIIQLQAIIFSAEKCANAE
jgi:ubiquinone/menaquinone biosynthesis C-methylase UbiE